KTYAHVNHKLILLESNHRRLGFTVFFPFRYLNRCWNTRERVLWDESLRRLSRSRRFHDVLSEFLLL
ncbi:unnamed protein product, partial [Brassica rapa subsp. narinosa]